MKIIIATVSASIILVLVLIVVVLHNSPSQFQQDIIGRITENYVRGSDLQISMYEITDFTWDKMIIFNAGTSGESINVALGVDYRGSLDLVEGVIFAYNGVVVFEDVQGWSGDGNTLFRYFVNASARGKNYAVFTPDNAVLYGSIIYRGSSAIYVLSADPRERP